MSKSLEALEDMISWMVDEQVNNFKEQLDTIKQDLELLEQLKQQRDSLAINNGELCVKVTDLQKENQELKDIADSFRKGNQGYCKKVSELEKENQELKEQLEIEKFDNFLVLGEKIDKLEKAIEILKDKCITNSNLWLIYNSNNYRDYKCFVENKDHELVRIEHNILTQQEYELLKEVLENEK